MSEEYGTLVSRQIDQPLSLADMTEDNVAIVFSLDVYPVILKVKLCMTWLVLFSAIQALVCMSE